MIDIHGVGSPSFENIQPSTRTDGIKGENELLQAASQKIPQKIRTETAEGSPIPPTGLKAELVPLEQLGATFDKLGE